jgi:tetratricopeptide (TPR) repeat protein
MAIGIMVTLLFTGCAVDLKTGKPINESPNTDYSAENRYYHFTEAQLHRKKGNLDKAIFHLNEALKEDPESLYLQKEIAILYLENKESLKALNTVEQILKREPENLDGLIMYGRIKQSLKQLEDAKEAYEKVIALDATRQNIYLLLGGIYMDENDLARAFEVYQKLVKHFPRSYVGHYYLGKIHVEQGNFEAAEKEFKKTLELEPDLEEPRFELLKIYRNPVDDFTVVTVKPGQSLSSIGLKLYGKYNAKIEKAILKHNPELENVHAVGVGQKLRFPSLMRIENEGKTVNNEKILQIYKDILNRNPENVRAAMELGYFYHEIGMINESQKIFKELGARSSSDPEIIRRVVQIYLDPKKYDASLIVLSGMLAGEPDSSDLRYLIGLAYDGIQDQVKAIESFKKVKPGTRFFQNATIQISFILQEQGKIEEAIAFLTDVIQRVPDNPEFMIYLGSFYEEVENFEKAEQILKQGLAIDPENVRLHFRLGVVYDKWGRKEASIEQMKTVINLDPKHANALNYLGYTYADMGQNLDEAERLIREALKYKPDDGYITDSLGWVYYKRGQYEEALKILKKAVGLVPDDPIILEHLGDVYMKLNNKKMALKYYRRSLLKRKDDKAAIEKKIQQLTQKGI